MRPRIIALVLIALFALTVAPSAHASTSFRVRVPIVFDDDGGDGTGYAFIRADGNWTLNRFRVVVNGTVLDTVTVYDTDAVYADWYEAVATYYESAGTSATHRPGLAFAAGRYIQFTIASFPPGFPSTLTGFVRLSISA